MAIEIIDDSHIIVVTNGLYPVGYFHLNTNMDVQKAFILKDEDSPNNDDVVIEHLSVIASILVKDNMLGKSVADEYVQNMICKVNNMSDNSEITFVRHVICELMGLDLEENCVLFSDENENTKKVSLLQDGLSPDTYFSKMEFVYLDELVESQIIQDFQAESVFQMKMPWWWE